MKWLLSWWHRRQRAMDVRLFWPTCKSACNTLDAAKVIFRMHMDMDPAYSDLSPLEKFRFLKELT